MKLSTVGWLGYGVFLVTYAAFKYLAAAPPEFSTIYAQSVAILVALTGVAPFLLAILLGKLLRLKGLAGIATGLAAGVVLCMAGYAAYWFMAIAPSGADVPMMAVAMRGIGWGLVQGGLAALITNH